jgi:hypothetical protein
MKQFESLGVQLQIEKIQASRVAAGPREARDKTKLDRVIAGAEPLSGSSASPLWPRSQRGRNRAWR